MTNRILIYILMAVSMLLWAGSWISAKVIANMAPAQVISFYRFLLTIISILPILIYSKQRLQWHKESVIYIIVGAILMVIYTQLFFYGLKTGLAGAGGVLVTTIMPLFTFVLVSVISRQQSSKRAYMGITLGFLAGLIMIAPWKYGIVELLQNGNLLFLLAAFSWSCLTIISQKAQAYMPSFSFTFYTQSLGLIILFMISYDDDLLQVFTLPPIFWINMVFLATFATAIATSIFFYGSKILGAKTAGSFTYLVPINAALLSFLILGEVPTMEIIIGGSMAILAVYLINTAHKK